MKRARAPNFSTQELMHLIQLAKKYPIIESKKTDGTTNADKKEAWKALAVEYNATTLTGPRTARKLRDCYKNQKLKARKLYSRERKQIKAPQTEEVNSKSNTTSEAVETNGQDSELDSQSMNSPSPDCTATFDDLVRQAKKQEIIFKKEILRLGGGPQQQPPNELVLEKSKSIIGPGSEGLYITVDGGDLGCMMYQKQNTHPVEKRLLTVDVPPGHGMEGSPYTPQRYNSPPIHHVVTPDIFNMEDTDIPNTAANINDDMLKRLNSLKKKKDSSINMYSDKKINISKSVLQLVEDKKNLFHTQKLAADCKLRHQQILTQIAEEKLEFERQKQTMELNYLKEKYELELSLLRNSNKTK